MSRVSDFLEGYDVQTWFTEPTFYELMVYPMEWETTEVFPGRVLRQYLPTFYSRVFGGARIVCLQTLVVLSRHEEWFADSLTMGLREFVNNNPEAESFPSDGYSMLWSGKLLEIPGNRVHYKTYTLIPLWPSTIEIDKEYNLKLGIPLPPDTSIPAMKSIVDPE